jgi:hypothetical protein
MRDEVFQWLGEGRWFSPGTPVSSTNNNDRHYVTEILLKVVLNQILYVYSKLDQLKCKRINHMHGTIFAQPNVNHHLYMLFEFRLYVNA